MKSGCGCFLLLVGLFGLIGTLGMVFSGSGGQVNITVNFILVGVFIVAGWILLSGGSNKDQPDSSRQPQPDQQQQPIINVRQTVHHASVAPAGRPQDWVREMNKLLDQTLKAIDHAKPSGGSGQARVPDGPVTVECPGCGAPVEVAPSRSGVCGYCGNQVQYNRPSGNTG